MKQLKEGTKKIIKVVVTLLIAASISLLIYLILYLCGLTDIETISHWILKYGGLAWIVFIVVRVTCTIFMSFVPACSMAFDGIAIMLFGSLMKYPSWEVFIICFISVILASTIMDLIGRYGGSKAIIRLVGEKDYNSALELIQTKGLVYVPVMYLLPIFPDDAICLVAGATKIKFPLHFLYIVLFRGIGCATVVFGTSILPPEIRSFTSKNIWDYIVVLTVIVFWIYMIFKFANRVDKYVTKKMQKKHEAKELEVKEGEKESNL